MAAGVRGLTLLRWGTKLQMKLSLKLLATTAFCLSAAPVFAQSAIHQQVSLHDVSVPAGALTTGLNRLAAQTGTQIIFDATLAAGKTTRGVHGRLSTQQALAAILAGSGLQPRFLSANSVTIDGPSGNEGIIRAGGAPGALELDAINVQGGNPLSTMTPPPEYSGGQVASGGQLGMLGNRSVMDVPFNQTSYTQKTIQNQQARKLDDVLANDPSVRVNVPRAYGFDFVFIRGFDVASTAYGINGLYGIASAFSFSSLNAFERVEVLKGPASLLNGMPPAGGVGGSVNLVTKRAGDDPLTQITNSFASRSQFGTHLDIGRRFGDNKEFGVRFNGSYRNGEIEIQNQKQELGSVALGLDYRGEHVRLSGDFGYEKNDVDAMSRFTIVGAQLTTVPRPPNANRNYMPDWAYWNGQGHYGLAQAEVDITDHVTAYAQAGLVKGATKYLYSDITVNNLNGEYAGSPRLNSQKRDQAAAQTGIRSQFDTSFIHHAVNFNAARSEGITSIINTTGTAFTSNIYNPRPSPTPAVSVGSPPKISDIYASSFGVADTMSVLDNRIQVTVGVRKQFVSSGNYSATTGAITSSYDSTALSPSYAVVVKPWENVSLYANYIEGLEPGSVVGIQYANAGQVLAPYQTKQYEAGVKVDWGSITTTASAFQITRPLQLVDLTTNSLTQDGESRNRGVELNTFGSLTEGLRLLGGVMFLDARQAKTQAGRYDGYKTFGVPNVQLNLGTEWDTPFIPGLTVGARAIYTSQLYADQPNTLVVPEWTRYDLNARYTLNAPWNNKPLVVRFAVENVLDKSYWQGTQTTRYLFLGSPRTYLVSTTFNF